jgi:heme o synthase
MISAEENISVIGRVKERVGILFELLKFRLASLIAFSGAMGYCLGAREVRASDIVLFVLASIGITGSANIINQILEKDLDKLMKRTAGRPLPSGRITVEQAIIWAILLGASAMVIFVSVFNLTTALISLLSLILYGFVYTPLKRVGPIAVFVGAFPGAFPPMIGWVAATNHFGLEPGILFAIQFFWQFPHFWAIAWVLDSDYKRAGFKLLPANGLKDSETTLRIMLYTLCLLPVGWLPYELGMTGINSAIVATVFGVLFLAQTFHLMRERTDKTARQLMFGSFIYLPIVQIAFLLDKI